MCVCVSVCVGGGGCVCVYAGVWYGCSMVVNERMVFYMRSYCSNNTT